MLSAIANRRSIRKYKKTPVPAMLLEEIVQAGIAAPSSKNRQPWKFIITAGGAKDDMLQAMRRGLEREKRNPLLPESACHLGGAEHTLNIMEEAPAVILVVNLLGIGMEQVLSPEERIYELCNAQSIGAAMQNMSITATEQGLGSLWICDTYFAYEELNGWIKEEGELIAAMAIGYADESPSARPRKALETVVEWRT